MRTLDGEALWEIYVCGGDISLFHLSSKMIYWHLNPPEWTILLSSNTVFS